MFVELPPFTQAVSVLTGPAKTTRISAQGPTDAKGKGVGDGDIRAQTVQILTNIESRLAAAGASPDHLVSYSIQLRRSEDLHAAVAASMERWGPRPHPPITSVQFVPKLP